MPEGLDTIVGDDGVLMSVGSGSSDCAGASQRCACFDYGRSDLGFG